MSPDIVVSIIGAIEAIVVAVIGGLLQRSLRRNEEYRKKRELRDSALYSLVLANSAGTEVLLHQAHGDNLNGNVDAAIHSIQKAKNNFQTICIEQAAKI